MANAGKQKLSIAAGKIPSSNASSEKHVAADEQVVRSRKETKAARTMTGNFEDLKLGTEKLSRRRFFDEKIRFHRFQIEPESESAKITGIGNHWIGLNMASDGTVESLLDVGDVLNVVDVAMGQKEELEIGTLLNQPLTDALRGIEQDGTFGCVNQIAVGLEQAATERFVTKHDLQ